MGFAVVYVLCISSAVVPLRLATSLEILELSQVTHVKYVFPKVPASQNWHLVGLLDV